jgi:Cysteine dioxygenase type I
MTTALRPDSPAALVSVAGGLAGTSGLAGPVTPVGAARLGQIVREIAAAAGQWRPVVRFCADHRWYYRLDPAGPDAGYEVWLLSWLPGQRTGFHDHGDAAGAFAIADGELLETTARVGDSAVRGRTLTAGAVRSFGPAHLHDVRNAAGRPAVSVHAYSPPLSLMRRYEMTSSGLALAGSETAAGGW